MWPSMSSGSNGSDVLKGYNLILLDDDNSHIHAFVYADTWKAISNNVVESGVYVIINFHTTEALGSLHPTSARLKSNFSKFTTIERIETEDYVLPRNKFEFSDLADLYSIVNGYENGDAPPFAIASIWGHLATTTTEAYEKVPGNEYSIIAIVTSAKLKTFKSSVMVSTLPSSKIYLNWVSEFVDAMRSRLEEGYKAPMKTYSLPIQIPASSTETITLKVIRPTQLMLRYRIIVVVEDAIVEYNFILLDSATQRLVWKTASELLFENKVCQYSILYPECLRQIICKEVTLKIEINDGNVLIKSKIFTATDAYDYFESSSSSFTVNTGSSSFSSPEVREKLNVVHFIVVSQIPTSNQYIDSNFLYVAEHDLIDVPLLVICNLCLAVN
ncbi:hypothetical protein ACET3Z_018064 [Daucus carota]